VQRALVLLLIVTAGGGSERTLLSASTDFRDALLLTARAEFSVYGTALEAAWRLLVR